MKEVLSVGDTNVTNIAKHCKPVLVVIAGFMREILFLQKKENLSECVQLVRSGYKILNSLDYPIPQSARIIGYNLEKAEDMSKTVSERHEYIQTALDQLCHVLFKAAVKEIEDGDESTTYADLATLLMIFFENRQK